MFDFRGGLWSGHRPTAVGAHPAARASSIQ